MNGKTTLLIYEAPEGRSLQEALSIWGPSLHEGGRAVALIYTPGFCSFATLDAGGRLRRLSPSSERLELVPVDLEEVYEVRVFSRAGELRWLNDPWGNHRSTLLRETPAPLSTDGSVLEQFTCSDTIEQTYVIWGRAHGLTQNPASYPDCWTRFSTAQIGALEVPVCDVPQGGRAALLAREYLRVLDEHGNVGVFEERLLGLNVTEVRDEHEY